MIAQDVPMPRKGRSNEEIVHALHQVEAGEQVTEICRRLGVSEQTFYRWKKQFAGLVVQELRALHAGGMGADDLSSEPTPGGEAHHGAHLNSISVGRVRCRSACRR